MKFYCYSKASKEENIHFETYQARKRPSPETDKENIKSTITPSPERKRTKTDGILSQSLAPKSPNTLSCTTTNADITVNIILQQVESSLSRHSLFDLLSSPLGMKVQLLVLQDPRVKLFQKVSSMIDSIVHGKSELPTCNRDPSHEFLTIPATIEALPNLRTYWNDREFTDRVVCGTQRSVFVVSVTKNVPFQVDVMDFIRGHVQIWSELELYPDYLASWMLRSFVGSKKVASLNMVTAGLLKEFEGDTQQTMDVIRLHYQILMETQAKQVRNDEKRKAKKVLESDEKVLSFLKMADKVFEDELDELSQGPAKMNVPLLDYNMVRDRLLLPMRDQLPNHFADVRKSLESKHYRSRLEDKDLLTVWEFFRRKRMVNQQLMVHWALVLAMAMEAEGNHGGCTSKHARFSRGAASKSAVKAYIKKIAESRPTPSEVLQKYERLTGAFDNFQKIMKLKFQCNGQSTNSILATSRYIALMKDPTVPESFDFPVNEGLPSRENFTLVQQIIPAPPGMPPMECVVTPKQLLQLLHDVDNGTLTDDSWIPDDSPPSHPIPFDFETMRPTDGKRVEAYMKHLATCRRMASIRRFLSAKNTVKNTTGHLSHLSASEKSRYESVWNAAHKFREPLLLGKKFQGNVVRLWNDTVDEVSELMPLSLDSQKEDTILGCGVVAIQILVDIGVLIPLNDKNTKFDLAPNWKSRKFDLFGDCLSIDYYLSFRRQLEKAVSVGYMDRQDVLKLLSEATSVLNPLPGDWHTLLHILVAIYKFAYGGFIQAFQTTVQFRNIVKDPTERFQKSADLLTLILGEIWREFHIGWSGTDHAQGSIDCPVEMALSMQKYLQDMKEKAAVDDEWLAFTIEFLELCEHFFSLFDDSIKSGDPVPVEAVYQGMMPVFEQSGKKKYREVVVRQTEVLYQQSEYHDSNSQTNASARALHEIRCNRFIRYNKGKGMVAKDDVCENINAFIGHLGGIQTKEQLIMKSGFVLQFKQCKHFVDTFYTRSTKHLSESEHLDDDDNLEDEVDKRNEEENILAGDDERDAASIDAEGERHNETNVNSDGVSTRREKISIKKPKSSIKPRRRREMKRIHELVILGKLTVHVPGRKLSDMNLYDLIDKLKTQLGPREEEEMQANSDNNVDSAELAGDDTQAEMEGCDADDDVLVPVEESVEVDLMHHLTDLLGSVSDEGDMEDEQEPGDAESEISGRGTSSRSSGLKEDEEYVMIANTKMTRYALDRTLVDNPPREKGLQKLLKMNLLQKRMDKKKRDVLEHKKNEVVRQIVNARRDANAEINLEPLESQELWRVEFDKHFNRFP